MTREAFRSFFFYLLMLACLAIQEENMAMTENEGQIPLGNDMYIDTTRPTTGYYALSEDSRVSNECPCDIEGIVDLCGSQAVAELCIRNAMKGGSAQEVVVEVVIDCDGLKRKLLGGKKCGAKVQTREVVLSEESNQDIEQEESQIAVPEIAPGITITSVIQDSIDSPDRQAQNEGLIWGDKVLDFPGVRPDVHVAVGSREGDAVKVDVNQLENPFTSPRITCDLSGKDGKLTIMYNEAGDECIREESFPVEEGKELDRRITELFTQYFMR